MVHVRGYHRTSRNLGGELKGANDSEQYKLIKKIMPEVECKKDVFGGDLFCITTMSKRKAWNLAVKRGFTQCQNKDYLSYNLGDKRIFAHNNHLLTTLSFSY